MAYDQILALGLNSRLYNILRIHSFPFIALISIRNYIIMDEIYQFSPAHDNNNLSEGTKYITFGAIKKLRNGQSGGWGGDRRVCYISLHRGVFHIMVM